MPSSQLDGLKQMHELALGSIGSSFLQQLRVSRGEGLGGLSQIRELALGSLSSAFSSQQLAALTKPSYLSQIREQMAALNQPSYLFQLRDAAVTMRMQGELSVALDSYRELVAGSALASFLVSAGEDESPPPQVVKLEGFDRLEVGDFAELEIGDAVSVDAEIVKAIQEDRVAGLSQDQIKRLILVCTILIGIWDMILRVASTPAAIGAITLLLGGAETPADIPQQIAPLSNYERMLLSDFRIVNREGARLRATPSTKGEVVTSLGFGQLVEVISYDEKGWYHVSVEHQGKQIEGWIYVSVTTPVPKPKGARGQNVDTDTD